MDGAPLALGFAGALLTAGILLGRSGSRSGEPERKLAGAAMNTVVFDGHHGGPLAQSSFGFGGSSKRKRMASLFSGGGLVEVGLRGLVEPVFAVEICRPIADVYKAAVGPHIEIEDVRNVVLPERGQVEYLHASPVCKSYSAANLVGGERSLDLETARATSDAIERLLPDVFTLENVPAYQGSQALQICVRTLVDLGYAVDGFVYKAEDYGSASRRKRFLLRAVRSGRLPPFPEPTHGPGRAHDHADWWSLLEGEVHGYEKTGLVPWISRRMDSAGISPSSIHAPLLVMGGSAGKNLVFSWAGSPAPTFKATPGEKHRILLPGGQIYTLPPSGIARLLGIPDDYPLPSRRALAVTILGNGVPPALSRAVFGPLLSC